MSSNRVEEFFGFKEMKNYRLVLRQLLSEFLGSFLYLSLSLSAGTGLIYHDTTGARVDEGSVTILTALANGLMIAALVAIFGHVSGGHINPAITCGALVCQHIKFIKAICYIIVQVIGAVVGAGVAYLLSSEIIRANLGAVVPYKSLSAVQVFGFEFLMTFVFVAVVLSVIDTSRGARGLGSSPLAIGLALTAGIACCSPYTGCMNPIRSFGPAVIMGIWDKQWVYWVGPIGGGLVAGAMYSFLSAYQHTILIQSHGDINRMLDAPRSE